jgi:coenzyme F420 biosynthesis associated uncharacterized protein
MDATTVDWSMGSSAARIADWDVALQIGRKVSGPGPRVVPAQRARMREDFAELVPHAEDLITAHTGMSVDSFRSRAWVMARSEWIRANLTGLQRLLEPLAERLVTEQRVGRGSFKRKAVGAQAGALFGYVGKRVLGQYDVFLPPDDEGLLYFVGPNVAEVEQRFSLPPRDFRLWVAIHEVTHRVQFGAAPWLRAHLQGLVDAYLAGISLDSREIIEQLKRAALEARNGADARMSGIFLLLSPEQRDLFLQMQGLMSLLEGHASYVMNEVAREHVRDVDRMRRALQTRRRGSSVDRGIQKAIGFDQKIQQYEGGERFVRGVIARAGMDGFNRVWAVPEHLPTLAEIREPARWVERVTE